MADPAVFLDRDGVVNRTIGPSMGPPPSVDQLVLADDASGQLARLADAGYQLVIVTNQPDVARGKVAGTEVDRVNAAVAAALPIRAVYCCIHDSRDGCTCRKPLPGMLLAAASDLGLSLGRSWLIGDRWTDVAAGASAGVRTILVSRTYSWAATSAGDPPSHLQPEHCVASLREAVDVILGAVRRDAGQPDGR
jgi:D-glycero-D-manno-heptose 1,7-bisphosphate phosphatase